MTSSSWLELIEKFRVIFSALTGACARCVLLLGSLDVSRAPRRRHVGTSTYEINFIFICTRRLCAVSRAGKRPPRSPPHLPPPTARPHSSAGHRAPLDPPPPCGEVRPQTRSRGRTQNEPIPALCAPLLLLYFLSLSLLFPYILSSLNYHQL